ncbi:MAG: DnaJ domain-containing protein [Synechococcus sp.]
MGFDPRRWSSEPRARQVTSNVETLLAENEALRREVRQLRLQLERLERLANRDPQPNYNHGRHWQQRQTVADPIHVSAQQVQSWGEDLAQQPGWSVLRQKGLVALVDQINRQSFHPQLTLQQRLDRLMPGLGRDLFKAIGRPLSKKHWAVLAAFALYGVRTREWLDEDPARVVAELRQRAVRGQNGRRTRSDQRRTDRHSEQRTSQQTPPDPTQRVGAPPGADPRCVEAYVVLGLQWGASRADIKQAHRRLVKRHHPDMGGSAAAFHRVNGAYQLLIT